MATYLDDIVAHHRTRASHDLRRWQQRMEEESLSAGPSLRAAIADAKAMAVIAEVKRHSPSRGDLAANLDVGALVAMYEEGGATGISVLTDEEFFRGSPEDLRAARRSTALPLLRKDFTVAPNDVIDAALWGASSVLLIVAALDDDELRLLLDVAGAVGVDALVEVHNEIELARAIDAGSRFIGVNQRDLHSFAVDPERAARVRAAVPAGVVTVAESGLRDVEGVRAASAAGFDAVLVGETFVSASAPTALVAAFAAVPKATRAS